LNLDPIVHFLRTVFESIHSLTPGVSYGLTIIIFTLLLKIVLLPFNYIQTKSTVKTQMVQPKLKELQKKYKGDSQKLQQAQMELYKQEGVNPLGGCLPLLIQMPVLFAIFYVFQGKNVFVGDAARFLWIPNLAIKDPFFILPVISGVTTFISTWMLTPKTAEPNPMSSKSTNLIMSGFFLYVSLNFQAGLVLYWVVNNMLQMGIQYYLNKILYKKAEVATQK
jgi:YidC/Oxa1 family membrane protein insertase